MDYPLPAVKGMVGEGGAREPLNAGVEQVRPGLWSIPVPIPGSPLGYTLVYCYETPRGPVLVDSGWDADESWDALRKGLAEAGQDVATCFGVLVTHVHPDHHGLSGRVRAASGAWVAMHPEDAVLISRQRQFSPEQWILQTAALLLDAGASEKDLAGLPPPESVRGGPVGPRPVVPDRLVGDGDRADVPGRDVMAIWTPGHSPGHSCFYDRDERLMLCGDHVLPRISPHIGVYNLEDEGSDPLGQFVESLRKVGAYDVDEALPAHEHRFRDLAARVAALEAHHRERLDAVLARLARGPASAWQIAMEMPWNRPWADIGTFMKRAALSEAMAHIRRLETTGEVEKLPGRALTFRLAGRGL